MVLNRRSFLILAIFVGIVISLLACNRADAPQEYSWDDPAPVEYSDPHDNIEIEIEIDGFKRKVKRGDYKSGRYKSFTGTPKSSSSWFSRKPSTPPSPSISKQNSGSSVSKPSASSPSRSTSSSSSSSSRSTSSSSSRSSSSRR